MTGLQPIDVHHPLSLVFNSFAHISEQFPLVRKEEIVAYQIRLEVLSPPPR